MNGAAQVNGGGSPSTLTNYVAFLKADSTVSQIGHLDSKSSTVQPLAFLSGTPLSNLYQVIEIGEKNIIPAGEPVDSTSVKILPPISGRDVLAVGKNYSEHAKEFNTSGYDSSDKVDIPTHPVIFSKRATSIIGDNEEIYPHPKFTQSLDYEGEIGVIIGKPGFRVGVDEAMDYVWGYTIINDMTARERQRDHKQFYIGKSPDTFCPMGPIAVPKEHLPKILRLQTFVNGEKKQDATIESLIFSVPYLVMTMSEGQTLQAGDVLATGTPAGVGIGKNPPVFLKPGDEIKVSVTGLGTLTNKIASVSSTNLTVARVEASSSISETNSAKSCYDAVGLSQINGKPLYYQRKGTDSTSTCFFVHGLGGTSEYFDGLYSLLRDSQSLHSFDLEGHGLSPTSPLSKLSISSFATDLQGVYTIAKVSSGSTLIAHSMGCLVAMDFALKNPNAVKNLILMGPPPSPLPEAGSKASYARAALARGKGMAAVVDAVSTAGTSEQTKAKNSLAVAAVRLSLLGQDPEGYAKACAALAGATNTLDISKITARTLILTGEEDKVSTPEACRQMQKKMSNCAESDVKVLKNVGHWHLFEDQDGVADAVREFLQVK